MNYMDGKQVQRAAKKSRQEALEDRFYAAWVESFSGLGLPERQWRFHHQRKWRFDFAWPHAKLAVELQGGSFIGGGHNRGAQQAKDYEKQRAAIRLGWRVLPFNTADMKDAEAVVTEVAEILCGAKEIA